MTTGPIAPRVPVDPGPRSLPKADDEHGRTEEGRSFADLLQAMLAPGAQPDEAAAKTPDAVFERLDAAEVFNETGLFRGAAPLTAENSAGAGQARTPGAPARPEMSAEAALQLSLAPSPDSIPAPPDVAPAAQPTAAEQIVLAGGSLPNTAHSSRAALREALSLRGQPVQAPQNPTQTPEAAREAAAAGRRPQTAAMLVQAYLAKGGSTAAQVSVQAVEGEISLVARADKLTREEREKLRIEIGELLARHGLAAAEIMINGEAPPSLRGRND